MAISPGFSVNRVKSRVNFDMAKVRDRGESFGRKYSGGIGRDPDCFGVVLILFPSNLFLAVIPLETLLNN